MKLKFFNSRIGREEMTRNKNRILEVQNRKGMKSGNGQSSLLLQKFNSQGYRPTTSGLNLIVKSRCFLI